MTKMADDRIRIPIERCVTEHAGRPWTAESIRDLSEYACHPCALLSDEFYAVFAKFSDAMDGCRQFEIELAGLRLLSERSGAFTPVPVGIVPVTGGSVLVMEAVQAVERASHHWRDIGRTLARIHRAKGNRFGLETSGYFGPLHQDNTPHTDWATFYGQRRLLPGLRMAMESGNLPVEVMRRAEELLARLPALCGPDVVPTLLHGDAQQNNFVSTERGAVVIDPAVYYGHPEVDLAFVDYFQPASDDVFAGYQDELTIDPGFWERRELWRLWGYLAAVTVEGTAYVGKVAEAIARYL